VSAETVAAKRTAREERRRANSERRRSKPFARRRLLSVPLPEQAAPRRDPLASAPATRRTGGTASPVRGPDQASRRRSPRGRHGAPGGAGADGASPLFASAALAAVPGPALPMPEPIAGPFRASWPSVGNLVATDGESDVATDI
jgi:hypothetical protein